MKIAEFSRGVVTPKAPGVGVERRFTRAGVDPLDKVTYELRDSVITNPDGSVVFEMRGAEIPASWSQLATDIAVSKYFRKAGVNGDPKRGERSARELVYRVGHTIREAGEKLGGYFADRDAADTFEAELNYILIHQIAAFNSPVWFNCGLYQRYGIDGSGGNYAWSPQTDSIIETKNAYENPQCSACFIQSVDDDLMSIYDLVKTEARLFKYGSGTGTNFSRLRGRQEKLSGGGTSSGLMSFLEVLDRAAGATKSGGTTRRAAKMVCLDMDHPEIVDFIQWKVQEEKKAQALIAQGYPADFNGPAYHTVSGQNSNNSVRVTDAFMRAVENDGEWRTYHRTTNQVGETMRARDLWRMVSESAWACADPGVQYDSTINDWHTCSNTSKIYASNPCVTGDTLVATAEGLRRIRDLVGEQPLLTTIEGNRRATKVWKTGHKPVYRLTTKAGFSLRLTADHPVFTVNRGDVPAAELRKGDVVRLVGGGFGSTRLQTKLAEAIGYAVGDGCIGEQTQGNRMLQVVGGEDDRAVLASFCEWVNESAKDAADGRTAKPTSVRETASHLVFATSKPHVVNEFTRFAILDRGSENKRFNDAVFGLDRESLAGVLRGLFTADGTVVDGGNSGRYVGLDSCSLELLRQVQTLLLTFGIKAKLYTDRRLLDRAMLPDGHGGLKEYPVKQMHSLRITRSSRVLFEREIGFCVESPKAQRLAAFSAFGAQADSMTDEVVTLVADGAEDVYDLTEPATSHFVANGLLVHNCSEYMFLDDTACNLSSINLTKLLDEDGNFDIEGYRHCIRVMILAQEILVDFSQYPTARIAQNSHDYRPLGLGYANLGTLLMKLGLGYDTDEGRSYCAALTGILCGHAYRVSAEIAAAKGSFPGFEKNRQPMMRVMNKHRDMAYRINQPGFPGFIGNRSADVPQALIDAAREDWDEAVQWGEKYGYRNAQATVLAPTGTIGLLMDCDTTGIEPDFSLVKFKKLAGGGYFKIVNQSVPAALKKLGYGETQIADIVAFVRGTNTFTGAPWLSRKMLLDKGLSASELEKAEAALVGAFDVQQALAPWVIGAAAYERLGITAQTMSKPGFSLLKHFGLTQQQIDELNDVVVGRMTVEGAPHLKQEHYAVFDCANRCGKNGKRFLEPLAHVRMMAAAQPFLSGAISKTVNLPNEATIEDVERIYMEGWKLGLKAIALYRDGCKASQPLSSSSDEKKAKSVDDDDNKIAAKKTATGDIVAVTLDRSSLIPAREGMNPPATLRHKLPKKRTGFTQEAKVAGHKIFLRTGEYEDGQLGEIFIDMHKEGAAFRSLMNCFAISVSMGLQHGVPLSSYVDQFTFTRFEPQGSVQGHPNIKFATSMIDYVFRVLGVEYLKRYDLAHVPPEEVQEDLNNPTDVETALRVAGQMPNTPPPDLTPAQQVEFGFHDGPTNGSSTSHAGPAAAAKPAGSALDRQLGEMMGDAPMCDSCGHITVRNGACYKCLNCGNSMGCS